MANRLRSVLFVDDPKAYVDQMNEWLGGKVVFTRNGDDGGLNFVEYDYNGASLSWMKPSDDTTNTPTRIGGNGSTNCLQLILESREVVDALYKKALELGFKSNFEPMVMEGENELNYWCGVKDKFNQHWVLNSA